VYLKVSPKGEGFIPSHRETVKEQLASRLLLHVQQPVGHDLPTILLEPQVRLHEEVLDLGLSVFGTLFQQGCPMPEPDERGQVAEDQRLAVAAGEFGVVGLRLDDVPDGVRQAHIALDAGVEADRDLEWLVFVARDLE
jgi:hypothetical protein